MSRRDWAGMIALAVAVGLAVSLAVGMIVAVASEDDISARAAILLAVIAGGMLALLGVFVALLGVTVRGSRRDDDAGPVSDETAELPLQPRDDTGKWKPGE